LACSTLVLKRSEDSGRKLGRTATVGELEQRVQVIAAVTSHPVGETDRTARAAEALDPPLKDRIAISR
jgi:hypothetical protein